jgi:hypothetical protein
MNILVTNDDGVSCYRRTRSKVFASHAGDCGFTVTGWIAGWIRAGGHISGLAVIPLLGFLRKAKILTPYRVVMFQSPRYSWTSLPILQSQRLIIGILLLTI